MIIPYEIKVIGTLETNQNDNSSLYVNKVQLTDGEKILNFDDYDTDDDALDVTLSSLSHAISQILIQENVPLDDYLKYFKMSYEQEKTFIEEVKI